MNPDIKLMIMKQMKYKEVPEKKKFQWITTDGQMFDYFVKAFQHQLTLVVEYA